jgi:hypothetical protein
MNAEQAKSLFKFVLMFTVAGVVIFAGILAANGMADADWFTWRK